MKEKRRSLRALWIVLALLLGLTISVSAAMLHNDYNGDGKIGSQDALYLLRHSLNPDKVTVIGKNAFPGDSSLTTVYYTGTAEQWCQMDTSDLIDVYYYLQPGDCYWYYADSVPTVKNQEGGKSL